VPYEGPFCGVGHTRLIGHWLQEIAQRPLSRWQAAYEANRIMVAFRRDHPAASEAASTDKRLANFVARAPNTPESDA
jgi:hypothetical protein